MNITHYHVRVGSDTGPVKYCVPVGATAVRPGDGDADFFISSFNATMGTESEKVSVPGSAGAPGGGLIIGLPNPPTGTTLTIVADGTAGYVAAVEWTKPATQGGTSGYQVELQYAEDDEGDTLIHDWGFGNTVNGYATEAHSYPPAPKATAARYARARVAGYNALGEISSYATSDWEEIAAVPALVLPDLTLPTDVTLSIGLHGTSYRATVEWTKPVTRGGTAGYQIQLTFATNADGSSIEADWGFSNQAQGYDAETYTYAASPRPTADRWAKARVATFNANGDLSTYVESPDWIKIDLADEVPVKEDPEVPTGVSLSIAVVSGRYIPTVTWTPPVSPGGTIGYVVQMRFATDSGGSSIEAGWGFDNQAEGTTTSTYSYAPQPLPGAIRWAQARVAARNAYGDLTAWATGSTWEEIEAATPGSIPDPDQPGSGDWSIALGPTQADAQTGEQYQRIDITITARPTGVEYWHVWVYEGASAPTDRAQWGAPFSQHITASGSTVIEFWKPRGLTNVTYQIAVTGNTSIVTVWPEPSVTPVKPVTVPAISASTVPTTWDITATSDELAGTLHGKYAITATLPTDANRDYWITERRWTQPSWGTPKSDWFPFFGARTLPWEQSPHEWAWPEDEWLEIRFGTVNYAGQITWHGTIKQLHLSGGGKINASALDPATVGEGVGIVNNKLEVLRAGAGVSNGDFRAGLKDWNLDPANSWSIVTTDAYQGNALRGNGNGVNKYANTNLVSVTPGTAYLATAYSRSTLSGGNGFWVISWWNSEGEYVTTTPWRDITGDSYKPYRAMGVVPDGVAFARITFAIPAAATSGRMLVDNVSLIELEPTGGGLTRIGEELVNTTREGGVQNGDFRAGLTFWDVNAGFTLESGGDAYAGNALRGAGNGVLKYATSAPASVIPGRILRCSVYTLSNLSGDTAKVFYRYDDKNGNFLSASTKTSVSTSGSYVEIPFLDVVPANAAFVRFALEVPAAATSGRVCIDNVHISIEEPLGSEFTRFNGQVIMDHLAVSKLTAGTAEFSGTVIFRRGTTGGQITIDGDGVKVEKPGTNLRWVNVTNDGLRVTSDYVDGYIPSLHGTTDVFGAGVRVRNPAFTQYSIMGHDFMQTPSLAIVDLVTAANAHFLHNGNQVNLSYPASWRAALGISTFSLQYKDHAGTNQTKTIYVP